MAEILIIEDDKTTLFALKRALEPEHATTACLCLADAWKALGKGTFSLILLDVMLPDGDGFEFFNELKKTAPIETVPVLFITGKSAVADQVLAFSLGAEDYIVKPVYPLLLQARINAKITKYQKLRNDSGTFVSGGLKFNLSKQRIYVCTDAGENELDLTSLEYKLLLHLARREDQIFSRDQLMTAVWGENIHILDRTIDTHVCHLRGKLKGSPYTVEAVHGVGYRLTCAKNGISKCAS